MKKINFAKARSYAIITLLLIATFEKENNRLFVIILSCLIVLIIMDLFGKIIFKNNRLVSNGFSWPLYIDRTKSRF